MKNLFGSTWGCFVYRFVFNNLWVPVLLVCSVMGATEFDVPDSSAAIHKATTSAQGQVDGTVDIKGNFRQDFNNGPSYHQHHHYHLKKITNEEISDIDSTDCMTASESDITFSEVISEEEKQRRLRDALRRKKKPNKVYIGESSDFGTTSISSGVVISLSIKRVPKKGDDEN